LQRQGRFPAISLGGVPLLKYLIETQLGLPVGLTSPSSVTIYHSKLQFINSLLVAISQSGQSLDLVEYDNSGKASGAKLISITNDTNSLLAQITDYHISLLAKPEVAVAATKSYVAQLFASLMLVEVWGKTFNDKQSIIDEPKKLVSLNTSMKHAVDLCQRSQQILILGRGFSYPNAREMALKIQETSKMSVQGLSIADYMHGPISGLTNKTQVFICVIHGMPLLPLENEIYSSIADAIVLQSFALEFALKNHLNPESPEGLSKVTITR
jgi:glucosamine--fructose-6-phosphate aminotransferase (isomerizing)